jgi:hypothetical protein
MGNRKRCPIFPNDTIPDGPLAAALREPLVFIDTHRFKAFCHLHRVAVGAARRNDGAADDGIPSGIGPLDLRFSHFRLLHPLN